MRNRNIRRRILSVVAFICAACLLGASSHAADEPQDPDHWRIWYGGGAWATQISQQYGGGALGAPVGSSYADVIAKLLAICQQVYTAASTGGACTGVQHFNTTTNNFGGQWDAVRVAWFCVTQTGFACGNSGMLNLFSSIAPCGTMTLGACSNFPPPQDADLTPHHQPPNNECKGNPCSLATRSKQQTFLDYQAPGIHFARTWRSDATPRTAYAGHYARVDVSTFQPQAVLPWGWSHSYSMKVLFDAGALTALYRPDGAIVDVVETAPSSGIYVGRDGSGIQARGSATSNITVYLPDGGTEFYAYVTCSGPPATAGHRLEQVIDSSGRITQLVFPAGCSPTAPPTKIVGPFGHELEIHYNTAGGTPRPFIQKLVDSAGEEILFAYTTKTGSFYSDTLLSAGACQKFCVRGGFHARELVNRSPYRMAN